MKGPYIFDDQFVPIEYIETVKTKWIKNFIECLICLESIKAKDMIETTCHHLYCDNVFSVFYIFMKKNVLYAGINKMIA